MGLNPNKSFILVFETEVKIYKELHDLEQISLK